MTKRQASNRLVVINHGSHQLATLQHVPHLDGVAATRHEHVRGGKEQHALDRLAVVHTDHYFLRARVDHLHRVVVGPRENEVVTRVASYATSDIVL